MRLMRMRACSHSCILPSQPEDDLVIDNLFSGSEYLTVPTPLRFAPSSPTRLTHFPLAQLPMFDVLMDNAGPNKEQRMQDMLVATQFFPYPAGAQSQSCVQLSSM